VPDVDLLAEWTRRVRASLVLTATAGGCAALLVLGAGLLPIRSFLWTILIVLPLLIGAVMLAVGRWMRRFPLTRLPIDHPPLQRIERTANAVAAVSGLLLVVGFILMGAGLSGVVAFWVPAAVVAAAPAVGAAWWGLRRVSSVERAAELQ
jgi:hypothetical protein